MNSDRLAYNRYIAYGSEADRAGFERHKSRHPELTRQLIADVDGVCR